MKYYEFKMYDNNGCVWNWEEYEDNVIIAANNSTEAKEKFLSNVSSDYEDEARQYDAYVIDDLEEYAENRYYTIWE